MPSGSYLLQQGDICCVDTHLMSLNIAPSLDTNNKESKPHRRVIRFLSAGSLISPNNMMAPAVEGNKTQHLTLNLFVTHNNTTSKC